LALLPGHLSLLQSNWFGTADATREAVVESRDAVRVGNHRYFAAVYLCVKAAVLAVLGALALLGCSGRSSRSAPVSPAAESQSVHLCTGQTTTTSTLAGPPAPVHSGPATPLIRFQVADRPSTDAPIAVGADGVTIDVVATTADDDPGRTISDAVFVVAAESGQTIRHFAMEQPWRATTHIVHLVWDRQDDAGRTASPGGYFLRVSYKVVIDRPVTCADGSGAGVERHESPSGDQAGIASLEVS
jgi:hypothetical protein